MLVKLTPEESDCKWIDSGQPFDNDVGESEQKRRRGSQQESQEGKDAMPEPDFPVLRSNLISLTIKLIATIPKKLDHFI